MNFRVLGLFFILSICICFAEPTQVGIQPQVAPPITQAQNIAFEDCSKMFNVNKEKLYYLTLGAITANRFSIKEIQTQNGYIIFKAANKEYLATRAGIDADNAILKITPCNNIYFFPPGIILNMFKYIELNLNTEIK